MRKLIILLSILLFLAVPTVYAQFDRDPNTHEAGYVDVVSYDYDKAAIGSPVYLYAATLFPSTSEAYVKVYDHATAALGTVAVEIGESEQYYSVREEFNPPLRLQNGAYVDVNNAAVILEYR